MKEPSWSVMIPSYGQGKFLAQTLASVIEQFDSLSSVQITVVENPSSFKSVAEVIREFGNSRVEHMINPTNIGVVANWNRCIELARGELVHLLHDDDYVLPGFYSKIETLARSHRDQGIFVARCFVVNESDELEDLSPRLRLLELDSHDAGDLLHENGVRCPGVVVRKSAYAEVGNYNPALPYTTDWEMWIRLIRRCGGIFINEPLVVYRYHSNNTSHALMRSGDVARSFWAMAHAMSKLGLEADLEGARTRSMNLAKSLATTYTAQGDVEAASNNSAVWQELVTLRDHLKSWIQSARFLAGKLFWVIFPSRRFRS